MSEVARAADVATGTVFQYAATKNELLMMVAASLLPRISAPISTPQSASRTTPAEAIERLIAPFVDMVHRYPGQTAWVAREILFGDQGPYRAEVLRFVEDLEEQITEHLPKGDHTSEGARLIVTGVLTELNRERQGRADHGTLAASVHRIVTLVVAGVSAAGQRS